MKDFVPAREAELVTFTQNFDSKIGTSWATYSLTEAQALEYHSRSVTFVNAYLTCQDQMTRSPGNITIKNDAKALLISYLRELAKIVQASPTVTNGQREELNLPIHDNQPTPAPVPTVAPSIELRNVGGNTISVILRDAVVQKRAKPAGVKAAAIYFHVGEEVPNENSVWTTFGTSGRTLLRLDFPSSLPQGTKVWVIAAWMNSRGQYGPSCQPVSAVLLGAMEFKKGNLSLAA